MNETILIWLFGIIAVLLSCIFGILYTQAQRLVKMETIFNFWVETIGKKAAQILHSPGDHFGLDKYLDSYIENHPDMNLQDWYELKILCERVERDETIESGKRLIAGFVAAGAIQKIMLMQNKLPTISELRPHPKTK